MNTKIIKTVATLFIFTILTSASPAAAPLADKVPENAIAYVGWSGRSLTFNGSMFGQLLSEQGVEDLFGAIRTAAGKGLEATGEADAPAMFESVWAMAAIAWQKPASAVLLDIKIPRRPNEGGAADGPDEPQPVGAILIDLGKDKAAFDAHLQKLLTIIGKENKLSQASLGNLSYQGFTTPAGKCSMGYVGDIFFICLGDGVPMKVASVANGKSRSLAGALGFKTAMKELADEQVQIAYYVDVPRLLTIAEKITPMPPTTAPADQSQFRRIVNAMGIDGATAIAGASNIVDRGFHEKCRIFSPAPHRGVLMPAAGKPLGAAALSDVPADADSVAAINIDPAAVLAEIKRVAVAIEPEAGKQFEEMLSAAGEQIGLDIEKDLLAHMGDQWTLISAPSLGGTFTGTAVTVQLKDAAKFSAALTKLEAQIDKMMGGGLGETMPAGPEGSGGDPKAGIRKYKSGDVEVHYVAMQGDTPIPVAPAWAVHKDKFYLAAFPQVVAATACGTPEKPLAQSANFAAFRKRLSPNASALSYTNTPSLIRRFYGVVLLGGTAATNALSQFAPSIKPEMLPPLPKVEKYVWPEIAAISSDANGITIESYGSMPSFITSNLPGAGTSLATSILLPALARAKGKAKQAVSATNLNIIGKGVIIYAAENDDQFPSNLIKLVEAGFLPVELLMSPSSGRKARKDSKGKPVGPFDYVYLGGQLTSSAPGSLIMAYERPEINKFQGTNVLYVDCHVAWVTMEQFQRDLAKTQEWI
ncbi:MAG: DUF3352 domain-containing protein, partial [Planctomycetota bacterium]|nr:DUF3352 domain-containing protein [Planctomycetota bacterium]